MAPPARARRAAPRPADDRPRRPGVPAWVWVLLAGAMVAVPVVLGGGYLIYQDQQDRAARAALEQHRSLRIHMQLAIDDWMQDKRRREEQIRRERPDVPDPWKAADDESMSGDAWRRMDDACQAVDRLERRWMSRWRALGIAPPP